MHVSGRVLSTGDGSRDWSSEGRERRDLCGRKIFEKERSLGTLKKRETVSRRGSRSLPSGKCMKYKRTLLQVRRLRCGTVG